MDEQNNEAERQRKTRVDLANAFSRRVTRPSEKPQVLMRVIAGAVALAVVAAAVFGIGALISYQKRKDEERRPRAAASPLTASPTAPATTPRPSSSPSKKASPSPSRAAARKPAAKPSRKAPAASARRRLPAGPKFSSVSGVVVRNKLGLCLDLPGDGKGAWDGPVYQDSCDGSARGNQRWDLVVGQKGAGPGGADLFGIPNSADGLCLDLPTNGSVTDSPVTEFICAPGDQDNQMWYLDPKGKGVFWVRNLRGGGRCLDTNTNEPGAGVYIFPCSMVADHLWSFSR